MFCLQNGGEFWYEKSAVEWVHFGKSKQMRENSNSFSLSDFQTLWVIEEVVGLIFIFP